jgi:CYTH domain-containing protein
LIIAEIEIPTKDYEVIIPDYLKELVLIEVTGMKPFSNRSLSLKIKKLVNVQ